MVDPIGGLGQWGDFTDEELKRDGTYSGLLLLPGGAYYDPVAGRYVQRVGDADNEYRSGDRGTVLFQMIGAVDVLHSGNGLDFIAGLGDGLAYNPIIGESSTGFARRNLGQLLGIGDANEVVDQKSYQYFWGGIASDVLTLFVPGGEAGSLAKGAELAEAAEVAGTAGRKVVVIGETMGRVTDLASELGAEYYHGMPGFQEGITPARLGRLHNRAWLIDKVQGNYLIIDAGLDESRFVRGASYARESRLLGRLKPEGHVKVAYPSSTSGVAH